MNSHRNRFERTMNLRSFENVNLKTARNRSKGSVESLILQYIVLWLNYDASFKVSVVHSSFARAEGKRLQLTQRKDRVYQDSASIRD